MNHFGNRYRDRSILVTGHTGFKGSWLALWLQRLGARVTGLALDPETRPNHFDLLRLPVDDHRGDIRDFGLVDRVLKAAAPEVVFHLAAQPLVRRSYREPVDTWSTNVLGTAHVLEACRRQPSVRAVVVITTDKCYLNREQVWGYRENETLGGHDPYSASKAAVELLVSSHRQSFWSAADAPLLASGRAGNVIGGGDWSEDRLIPDAARAVAAGGSLEIRSPGATRPWQHVLESLSGYLVLGQKLMEGRREFADAFNFGPGLEGNRTVASVLTRLREHWPGLRWHQTAAPQPHETTLLQLDSTKAQRALGWVPVWSIDEGIARTADWYHRYTTAGEVISVAQLEAFCQAAGDLGREWARPAP